MAVVSKLPFVINSNHEMWPPLKENLEAKEGTGHSLQGTLRMINCEASLYAVGLLLWRNIISYIESCAHIFKGDQVFCMKLSPKFLLSTRHTLGGG